MHPYKRTVSLLSILPILLFSCYKAKVNFGELRNTSPTNVIQTDTFTVAVSTVLLDSFVTSDQKKYLIGRLKDPYLGTTTAKAYFSFGIPEDPTDISASANYDSTQLIVGLEPYYYGDTTIHQKIIVEELVNPITYSYNNKLFNTSETATFPAILASSDLSVPSLSKDSIAIKLPNTLGAQWFSGLKNKDEIFESNAKFLQAFKGVALGVSKFDSSYLKQITIDKSRTKIRIFYHTNYPFLQKKFIDFPVLESEPSYNRVVTDRSQSFLSFPVRPNEEIPSSQTNHYGLMQPGTGLMLKLSFPTLKSVLYQSDIVRVIDAALILKPVGFSYDEYKWRLPKALSLSVTNGTNIPGPFIAERDGSHRQALLTVDNLYQEKTKYTCNITDYIAGMLSNQLPKDFALYVTEFIPGSAPITVDRAIMGDKFTNYRTQLVLTFLTVKH